ncbi:MAG TPA: tetratricopeptide repeat protein, partial [Thermoanaerobaculia bacterium]|nr:tetratricopeptide repeat protein [Thermoanaerobaculia bacterium]
MIRSLIGVVAAAAIASSPMLRPSNSQRLTESGRSAFVEGRMGDAVASFGAAAAIRPDEIARFNLGTAKLAAGDATGAPILDELAAGAHPVGRDALFNLGNAALSAKKWDDAIARYAEVLRRSPRDADAKRNLEIALRQRQAEQERGDQGQPSPQPTPSQGEDEQQQPQPAEQGEGKEEMSPEEILRSIAQ